MTAESLRVHFTNAARNATTPHDIVEAIKILPSGAENQIADFITAFCRANGIDTQSDELQKYYKLTAEYKAAQEAQKMRAALGRAFSDIEAITKEYRENETRGAFPDREQIDTITERIKKQTASLGATQGKRRIYTAADYIDECLTYDPSKDFTPALFGGLAFPNGTTSYIGARTSRGKTTAMVNLAREALSANRKTIFITLEMSGKQIFNKMILSTAFTDSVTTGADNTLEAINDPARLIYSVWKRLDLPGAESKIYRDYVNEAYKEVFTAQEKGLFILYDGRGATEPEIINFITSQAEKDTVILLDYIQKMPPKPGTDTDSFRRVQAISYDVVNAAAETNAVIIAGAQFNRLGGSDGLGDMFDDQSFREAGDIEQDAHNAIGIGWTPDKQGRFYEVLKTREDKKQGLLYNLHFHGGYSYMGQGSQTYRPQGKAAAKDKTPKPSTAQKTDIQFTGGEIL